MDDFLLELRALDETQERVEAVSDEMLHAHAEGDVTRVNTMVDHWIDALRASDLHSERVAFLYVANHVLQKTLFEGDADSAGSNTPHAFVGFFGAHMEEAVSLVSNSPMDRQNVTRLLELWHEKDVREVLPANEHSVLLSGYKGIHVLTYVGYNTSDLPRRGDPAHVEVHGGGPAQFPAGCRSEQLDERHWQQRQSRAERTGRR